MGNSQTNPCRNLDKRSVRRIYRKDYVREIRKYKESPPPIPSEIEENASSSDKQICVFVRKRPMFKKDKKAGEFDAVTCREKRHICIHDARIHADMIRQFMRNHTFSFSRVFDARAKNETVYEEAARPLVDYAVGGGFATCLMYGQTGSGKTYTMCAIYEQAARDVFARIRPHQSVSVSFCEIAGDRCSDLLNSYEDAPLMRAKDGSFHGYPLVEPSVACLDDLLSMIRFGCAMRATEATGVHDASSRSHAILRVYIQNTRRNDCDSSKMESVEGEHREGTLTLVDLAGSEHRIDSMYHSAQLRKECAQINASLMALKKCIRTQMRISRKDSKNSDHHVYRTSKLTMALKSSFAFARSRTVVIATVSPTSKDTEHTLSTLRHVSLMKCGGRGAKRNVNLRRRRSSSSSSSSGGESCVGEHVSEIEMGRINVTEEARRRRGQSDEVEKQLRSNGNAFGGHTSGSATTPLTGKEIARIRRKREVLAMRQLKSPQLSLLNNARRLLRGMNTLQQTRVMHGALGRLRSRSLTNATTTPPLVVEEKRKTTSPPTKSVSETPANGHSKQERQRKPVRRRSRVSAPVVAKSKSLKLQDLNEPIRGVPGSSEMSTALANIKRKKVSRNRTLSEGKQVKREKSVCTSKEPIRVKRPESIPASTNVRALSISDASRVVRVGIGKRSTPAGRRPQRRRSDPAFAPSSPPCVPHTPVQHRSKSAARGAAQLRARKYKSGSSILSSNLGSGSKDESAIVAKPSHFDAEEWKKIPPEIQAIVAKQFSRLCVKTGKNRVATADQTYPDGSHIEARWTKSDNIVVPASDNEPPRYYDAVVLAYCDRTKTYRVRYSGAGGAVRTAMRSEYIRWPKKGERNVSTPSSHNAVMAKGSLAATRRRDDGTPTFDSQNSSAEQDTKTSGHTRVSEARADIDSSSPDAQRVVSPAAEPSSSGVDSVILAEIKALEEKIAQSKSSATRSGLKKRLAMKRAVLIRKKRREEQKRREAAKRSLNVWKESREMDGNRGARDSTFAGEKSVGTKPPAITPGFRSPVKEAFVWDKAASSEGRWGPDGSWIPRE
eukprot:g2102.t1